MQKEARAYYQLHHGGTESPNNFLVLTWWVTPEGEQTLERDARVVTSLEEARSRLSPGRRCIPRRDIDRPSLIESWVSVHPPENSTVRFRIAGGLGPNADSYSTELYFVQPDGRCIRDGVAVFHNTLEEARQVVHAGGLPMKLVQGRTGVESPGGTVETWAIDVEKAHLERPDLCVPPTGEQASFSPEHAILYFHIYEGGRPYPGKYIIGTWAVAAGGTQTSAEEFVVVETLDEARDMLLQEDSSLKRLHRKAFVPPPDLPHLLRIVEAWVSDPDRARRLVPEVFRT